jgi:hypothetical protein
MSAVRTTPGAGPVDEAEGPVDEAGRRLDAISQGVTDGHDRLATAVGTSSARPRVVWRHTDTDLNGALRTALAAPSYRRGPDGKPLSTEDRVRILRSLGIATLWAAEGCRTTGMLQVGEMDSALRLGGELRADLFPTWMHCYAASTLGRTWMLLPDPGQHNVYGAETEGGLPGRIDEKGPRGVVGEAQEAGALPAVAVTVVLVVAVAALALAVCYCAEVAGQVVDRKLTEDAITERMMQSQARAIGMVSDHLERERQAGHTLPWDPGEQATLDALNGVQRELAQRDHTPMPTPFAGAVSRGRKAVERAGDEIGGIGTGLVIAGLVAGGAYLALRTRTPTQGA